MTHPFAPMLAPWAAPPPAHPLALASRSGQEHPHRQTGSEASQRRRHRSRRARHRLGPGESPTAKRVPEDLHPT